MQRALTFEQQKKGLKIQFSMWNKPGRERQISYNMAYIWSLKKNANKIIYKTEKTHLHINQP